MKLPKVLWILVFLLVSCASVPMGTDAENQAALTFTPPARMANVYIIRRPAYAGAAMANYDRLGQPKFAAQPRQITGKNSRPVVLMRYIATAMSVKIN